VSAALLPTGTQVFSRSNRVSKKV